MCLRISMGRTSSAPGEGRSLDAAGAQQEDLDS
jgi:hypothetical protein